jgi:hypothetical protein
MPADQDAVGVHEEVRSSDTEDGRLQQFSVSQNKPLLSTRTAARDRRYTAGTSLTADRWLIMRLARVVNTHRPVSGSSVRVIGRTSRKLLGSIGSAGALAARWCPTTLLADAARI